MPPSLFTQTAANAYQGRQIKWASIVKDVPELQGVRQRETE